MQRKRKLKAVSLFSSAGIGELGLKANNIEIVLSNEIDPKRHRLYKQNFPSAEDLLGDIRELKSDIIARLHAKFRNEDWFLVYATPPCQGMSSNGAGKLLQGVRSGERSAVDERNRLVIPAMDVITELRPRWVLLENVPGMKDTKITDESGTETNIIRYIEKRLGSEYVGGCEVVACQDFGIPQLRRRLIGIYTRDPGGIEYYNQNGFTFLPDAAKRARVTLREAIGHLPSLDSVLGAESRADFHPLHFVPIMKPEKHWWLSHTPEGDTAYNNQCSSSECGFQGNVRHRDERQDGVWRSAKGTPIYCEKCHTLLPRPSVIDKVTGERRLLKGFHSAYRRMKWDEPAPTLTQNLLYEASDNKVHPSQTRVLSIYEALVIQTVQDYGYDFRLDGEYIAAPFFAEVIGESVPPKLIDIICEMIIRVSSN